MPRQELTIKQQLSRCRTNLYLEKRKNRKLKELLEEEKERVKSERNFINQLIDENSELHRKVVELQYYSKEE